MTTRCIVPFCKHTTRRRDYAEWICAEHWSMTSPAWRRRYSLFKRRGWPGPIYHMWERLKRQAIERAVGI